MQDNLNNRDKISIAISSEAQRSLLDQMPTNRLRPRRTPTDAEFLALPLRVGQVDPCKVYDAKGELVARFEYEDVAALAVVLLNQTSTEQRTSDL
jgi:hypothetical protein